MKKPLEIPVEVTAENHNRGVFLPSTIDLAAFEKVAPRITRLRLESDSPICLFIHCWGGNPFIAESIMRLIRAPRQDGKRCQVTTVCIGMAASAAADLLVAGDYAIAYPEAVVHCHGTREAHNELTVETLPQVEAGLRDGNEYFAMKLASRMFRRFVTKALLFEIFKTNPPTLNIAAVAADPGELLSRLADEVAATHKDLVTEAIERTEKMRVLFEYIRSKKTIEPGADAIVSDAALLKVIVDFESNALVDRKSKGESIAGFTPDDIGLIREDFINLKELFSGGYQKQSLELSHRKGHYFLTHEEVNTLKTIPADDVTARHQFLEEKAAPKIFPLWYVVVSLCRLLQQGEHQFSAADAWHFGLIDEVTGSNLPSLRKWRELKREANKIQAAKAAANGNSPTKLTPPPSPPSAPSAVSARA